MPFKKGRSTDRRARLSRTTLVQKVEWSLVVVRYLACILAGTHAVLDGDLSIIRIVSIFIAAAVAHNALVHWIMYRKQYGFFTSAFNFFLYLAFCCFIIAITGGAASYFAPVLFFFIVGYHIYEPQSGNTLWITLLVCAAYSFTIVLGWFMTGFNWLHVPVYVNLAFFATCGGVMGVLSQLLHVLEKETRHHAAALESSEETLRAILNHTAHPIVVYDDNELITEVNDSACNFLGTSRLNMIGMRFQTYLFDDGSLGEALQELKESGSLYQEMLIVPANGSERAVFMHIHSFLGEKKRFFVALFHDITEQKELNETHRLAKIRLEEANRELQRAAEMRAAFYTSVANQLRSPLAAMLGYIDMLLEEHLGSINPEQREALYSCRRSLHRIFERLDEVFMPEPEVKKERETDFTEDLGAGI
ncbi:MAG: PAS domain S-box protein [Candidatus Hydrogenedens sp.]|jgi:PAS domain S-box-containing protein|nr:PAS domain S-box protein [Candidatus Hydrogenedens sp.]